MFEEVQSLKLKKSAKQKMSFFLAVFANFVHNLKK